MVLAPNEAVTNVVDHAKPGTHRLCAPGLTPHNRQAWTGVRAEADQLYRDVREVFHSELEDAERDASTDPQGVSGDVVSSI